LFFGTTANLAENNIKEVIIIELGLMSDDPRTHGVVQPDKLIFQRFNIGRPTPLPCRQAGVI